MNEPFYEFTILDEAHRFDFISVGKKEIAKSIVYYHTSVPDFYSLVLADIENGVSNFYTKSNNGDMKFILSTVYQTLDHFLKTNPDAVVGFTGSTESRTRLYQIAICVHLNRMKEHFQIFGVAEGKTIPETFAVGKKYQHFFICLKSRKFEAH